VQSENNQESSKFNLLGKSYNNYQEAIPDGVEYSVKKYLKGEFVARQGEICKGLYLLIKGSVRTEMIAENGVSLYIETIDAVRPLASAFIFATANNFPVDVIALEESEVLFISREDILSILQKDQDLLLRYLRYNSDKTQFLSNKIQMLSIKTIKSKLAHYILELFKAEQKIKPGSSTIIMDKNQTELAAYFGVTRPSLARALGEMARDGLISVNRKTVSIKNLKGLIETEG
jgi:CRP-like cAMP-binding protein